MAAAGTDSLAAKAEIDAPAAAVAAEAGWRLAVRLTYVRTDADTVETSWRATAPSSITERRRDHRLYSL